VKDQEGICASGPTVQEIFGLQQGSRAMLRRTMSHGSFRMVASKRPDVAVLMEALDGQVCTATIANDDVFELRLDKPVTLQFAYEDVTVRLARNENGLFRVSLSGRGEIPLLQEVANIHLRLEACCLVLADDQPRLKLTSTPGCIKIEVYTAPFLVRESALIRAFAPETIEVFDLIRLEDASFDPPEYAPKVEHER
jgi:hypothetical protein